MNVSGVSLCRFGLCDIVVIIFRMLLLLRLVWIYFYCLVLLCL